MKFRVDGRDKFTFYDGSPERVRKAVTAIKDATSALTILFGSNRRKALFQELTDNGLLTEWKTRFGLKLDFFPEKVQLSGPKTGQGSFMRNIALSATDFDLRYRLRHLDAATAQLFVSSESAASTKLYSMSVHGQCRVRYLADSNSVEVVGTSRQAAIECEQGVNKLLQELGGAYDVDETCSFCNEACPCEAFSLCGHAYCVRCLESLVTERGFSTQLLRCGRIGCRSLISVQDFQYSLDKSTFSQGIFQRVAACLQETARAQQLHSEGHGLQNIALNDPLGVPVAMCPTGIPSCASLLHYNVIKFRRMRSHPQQKRLLPFVHVPRFIISFSSPV